MVKTPRATPDEVLDLVRSATPEDAQEIYDRVLEMTRPAPQRPTVARQIMCAEHPDRAATFQYERDERPVYCCDECTPKAAA